jgi:hypothetical protein
MVCSASISLSYVPVVIPENRALLRRRLREGEEAFAEWFIPLEAAIVCRNLLLTGFIRDLFRIVFWVDPGYSSQGLGIPG